MISAMGFVGAAICVACAVSNAINIPFAPAAWIASAVSAVICAAVGVAFWGSK